MNAGTHQGTSRPEGGSLVGLILSHGGWPQGRGAS